MIMGKLKEATREQHESLEQTVDVMNQMFNLENYKTLLSKFYRFYSAIEPELAKLDLNKYGYDLSSRLKTPKLEKDLEYLGLLETAKSLQAWEKLPALDSPEKAFGALYVIEGATLGGQIINRHLKEQLDLTPENGGLFFSGYGQKTGEMWKEFIQTTTNFAFAANKDETIVESAKETFDSFKNCFTEPISFSKTTN
jgi:heme oxygenase (biliverdin-IX-beta and delta-forming)